MGFDHRTNRRSSKTHHGPKGTFKSDRLLRDTQVPTRDPVEPCVKLLTSTFIGRIIQSYLSFYLGLFLFLTVLFLSSPLITLFSLIWYFCCFTLSPEIFLIILTVLWSTQTSSFILSSVFLVYLSYLYPYNVILGLSHFFIIYNTVIYTFISIFMFKDLFMLFLHSFDRVLLCLVDLSRFWQCL